MPIVREPGRLPYYRSETPNRVGGQAPVIVTPELWADDPALLTPELADWWASVLPTLGDYAALIERLGPGGCDALARALGHVDYALWARYLDIVSDDLDTTIAERARFLDAARECPHCPG
jgi:hypothetical protein